MNKSDIDSIVSALIARTGIVKAAQLEHEFKVWQADSKVGFGQFLVTRGVISAQEFASLSSLAQAHVSRSGDTPQHAAMTLANLGFLMPESGIGKALTTLVRDEPTNHVSENGASKNIPDPSSGSLPLSDGISGSDCPTNLAAKNGNHDRATNSDSQHGRFTIIAEHASGGLGRVYRATDLELNREVALKKIKQRFSEDNSLRQRFLVEAEITGGLEHPGVVPVYGLGRTPEGEPFYAMRFIRGESLSEAIDEYYAKRVANSANNVEFRRLLQRFVDVCYTLHYAHSRGVIHRDIKPDNIMLGEFGETLVVDWGIAKVIGRSSVETPEAISSHDTLRPTSGSNATRHGNLIGTPGFMSPTQALGWHDSLSPRDDVFSLGATLYCLVTGERPFKGTTPQVAIQEVISGEIPEPKTVNATVPAALNAICRRAMHQKGSCRYASARELAEDLEAYLADEPTSAWKEPLRLRAKRWLRKNKAFASSLTATIAVVTIGSVVASLLLAAANRRESDARKLAQDNFNRARTIVDEFFTQVSESPELLKGTPGTQQLRRELLEKAQRYYQQFLDENRQVDSAKDLAMASFRLANISHELGDHQMAIKQYQTTVDSLSKLESQDKTTETMLVIGRAMNRLSRNYRETGDVKGAIESGEQAVALQSTLAGHRKGTPKSTVTNLVTQDVFYEWALAHRNLAEAYRRSDNRDEARKQFDLSESKFGELKDVGWRSEITVAAIDTSSAYADFLSDIGQSKFTLQKRIELARATESFVSKSPQNPDLREMQGKQLLSLAEEYQFQQQPANYRKILSQAQTSFRTLHDENPLVPRYQYLLCRCNRMSADVVDDADVEATLREAYDAAKTLTETSNDNVAYKVEFATASADLAQYYLKKQRRDEASKLLEQAVATADALAPLATSTYFAELAEALESMARAYGLHEQNSDATTTYTKALGLRRKLFDAFPDSVKHQANLARVHTALSLELTGALEIDEALEHVDKAIGLSTQVANALSDVPEYREIQIETLISKVNLLVHLQRSGIARKTIAELEEISSESTKRFPEYRDGLFRQREAIGLFLLGDLLVNENKYVDSIEVLNKSLKVLKEHQAKFPTVAANYVLIPTVLRRLSVAYYNSEQVDEALRQLGDGIKQLEEHTSKWPDYAALGQLAACHRTAGLFAQDQGDHELAIQYFATGEKLADTVIEEVDGDRIARETRSEVRWAQAESLIEVVRKSLFETIDTEGDTSATKTAVFQEALQNARHACELTDWKDWKATRMLALTYAAMNSESEADVWFEKSIDLAPDDEKENIRNEFSAIKDET